MEVWEFIKAYFAEHKYSPSLREIATALNTSTSVVDYCLTSLSANGFVERIPKIARGIVLKDVE